MVERLSQAILTDEDICQALKLRELKTQIERKRFMWNGTLMSIDSRPIRFQLVVLKKKPFTPLCF